MLIAISISSFMSCKFFKNQKSGYRSKILCFQIKNYGEKKKGRSNGDPSNREKLRYTFIVSWIKSIIDPDYAFRWRPCKNICWLWLGSIRLQFHRKLYSRLKESKIEKKVVYAIRKCGYHWIPIINHSYNMLSSKILWQKNLWDIKSKKPARIPGRF